MGLKNVFSGYYFQRMFDLYKTMFIDTVAAKRISFMLLSEDIALYMNNSSDNYFCGSTFLALRDKEIRVFADLSRGI